MQVRSGFGMSHMKATQRCPCGFRGDIIKNCVCTPYQVERYWGKLSGPLLDRIDIHLEVPRLSENELLCDRPAEPSTVIRQRVIEARNHQLARFSESELTANSQMKPTHIRQYCKLDPASRSLLHRAIQRLNFSARAYDRILKVARTIADLEAAQDIQVHHVAEAIQFRTLDRQKDVAA